MLPKTTARLGALALALLVQTSTASAASPDDVQTFKLANGMEVLVVEDHSIPNANMYLFWKVGSRNERPGITGLSHFFEHMMFNGAKKYGPKQFDVVMEANGGANNAYTTQDSTVYTDWFPAGSLEVVFDLEADRIGSLALDDKMVASERKVVTSELSTGLENSNWRTLSQEVKGIAYRAHPYSWPVLGHASDIKAWKKADLRAYYRQFYAANNATVVIAGDVKRAEVERLARQYFEPIPAQPAPPTIDTVEPEQKGERRAFVHKASVTTPNIMVAYHVPPTQHADHYALAALDAILSGGKTSRLYKALVDEQQLATAAQSYLPDSLDPGLFYLYAVATKGVSAEALEKALFAVITKVAKDGVSENELQKVKNQQAMGFHAAMATINGKAQALGTYDLFHGDWRKAFTATDDFSKVTPADVQRVAKQFLRKANRSVGILGNSEGDQ